MKSSGCPSSYIITVKQSETKKGGSSSKVNARAWCVCFLVNVPSYTFFGASQSKAMIDNGVEKYNKKYE